MLAAVYTRVSTQGQVEHGYSLEDQESRCAARAKELGATEIRIYQDAGESASTDARPALTRLRNDLQIGGIDLVVILDPDRLARKLAHQLLITDEIERRARLEFVNFDWNNTPDGRLFYSLRGAVAEYEREKIRERSMRGREAKGRAGRVIVGGWYGYSRQADTWEPDDHAEIVRQMYTWVAQERLSPAQIAGRLATMGIPGPRGPIWYASVILAMLRNPVYMGIVFNLRERLRHDVTHWNELLRLNIDDLPGGLQPVHITPIVDAELWYRAQRVLDTTQIRGQTITERRQTTLLSGLLLCGACGSHMSGVSTVSAGKRYRYYRCNRWWPSRSTPGQDMEQARCRVRGYGEQLDALVWGEVLRVLNHPDRVLEEFEASDTQKATAAEQARLERQLEWWQAKRSRTVRAFTAGWLPESEARQEIATCDREIQHCRADLETAVAIGQTAAYVKEHKANIHELCSRLLSSADGANTEQKRAILRTLVDRIVFDGRDLRIVGRFDSAALNGASVPFVAEIPTATA